MQGVERKETRGLLSSLERNVLLHHMLTTAVAIELNEAAVARIDWWHMCGLGWPHLLGLLSAAGQQNLGLFMTLLQHFQLQSQKSHV